MLEIVGVDAWKLTIPRSQPFAIALGTIVGAENVLVRVRAAGGAYGLGEGSPLRYVTGETQGTAFLLAGELGRLLLGKDALAVGARVAEMDRFLAGNPTLKSAFDMALHDLAAKHAGLPLYAFLGGERRSLWTDDTIGLDSPEAMAEAARDVLARGFPAVKVKLGTGREEDVTRCKAIRRAVGPDVPLRIDANQGWDAATAVQVLHELASLGIEYCEQPVPRWDLDGLCRVRAASPIPIMADESLFDAHDALRLAQMGACDLFNIKLAKCGGIHEALRIVAVAEAAGVPCMLGCMWETRLALSAMAHLVSARPAFRYADLDGHTGHGEDPILGGVTYTGGRIDLPATPGHGAEVDPEFLTRMEGYTVGSGA
ncbi:MAG TPA: dipeptide epimerase [Anaerolineae bacterium]|nr:dipeptide epimerase [Anaerolineae bacterium]